MNVVSGGHLPEICRLSRFLFFFLVFYHHNCVRRDSQLRGRVRKLGVKPPAAGGEEGAESPALGDFAFFNERNSLLDIVRPK